MSTTLLAVLSVVVALAVVALQAYQSRQWEKERAVWFSERARLLDAALSSTSGDFRVRQTTPVAQYDGHTVERVAQPNERKPRPVPIGLNGGGWD